ncbi:MAG: hypothetical protein DRH57_06700 [Candidatus Cloacimonadota bacterium]|nr:MAG: hypothetical protein DRH57_06700 [Candidatus Cloacimonadota bacterium]
MNICIFEDDMYRNFFPLTYLRACFDLRCGIFKLRQKIAYFFSNCTISYLIREELVPYYKYRFPDRNFNYILEGDTLFINGRVLFDSTIHNEIISLEKGALKNKNEIIALRTNIVKSQKFTFSNLKEQIKDMDSHLIKDTKISLINYLWEFISNNCNEIEKDFHRLVGKRRNHILRHADIKSYFINEKAIFIGKDVIINVGTIFDAKQGPIFIDDNAEIMANSTIIGPVYIGKHSKIKVGAKIYEGTSIGNLCKVGGEVEETIIQAYSNKQHDGFLGHSYLGEWVNIGADTNNSDLKNTYKNVKVYFYPQNRKIDSGSKFVGLIMGDHSKCGINSMFNTGCVVGIGCNLYSAELITDFIPSFSWGTANNLVEYKFDKFLETAKIVKSRRNLQILPPEKILLENIWKETKYLRKKILTTESQIHSVR